MTETFEGGPAVIGATHPTIIPEETGMTPSRIQQQRAKGWRKPDGAVAVHRSTRWGNPFSITKHHIWYSVGWDTTRFGTPPANASESMYQTTDKTAANWAATMYFYVHLRDEAPALLAAAHTELAGRDQEGGADTFATGARWTVRMIREAIERGAPAPPVVRDRPHLAAVQQSAP